MKIIINQANEDSNFKQEANNYLSGYLYNELNQQEKSVLFISEFSFYRTNKGEAYFENLNPYCFKDNIDSIFDNLKELFKVNIKLPIYS